MGDSTRWWIHPFPDGTDLVELLAADPADREEAADVAAQSDGLRPDQVVLLPPVYPVAMRDFLTFEAHVEGWSKGSTATPGRRRSGTPPRSSCSWPRTPCTVPYDDVATRRTPSGSTSSSSSRR